VIGVLAGLVVLGLVLAFIGVHGLSSAAPLVQSGPVLPTTATADTGSPTGASPSGSSPTASDPAATGTASPSVEAATVSGIEAIDPQGDGDENGSSADNAIDSDAASTWRSSGYRSAEFGGLKKGLGLYLSLAAGRVTSVRVEMPGSGGTVELRTATGPGLESSAVIATAEAQDGVAVLTPQQPVPASALLLWFTALPQQSSGEYRLVVSEITLS
jgi:hypothetical protein